MSRIAIAFVISILVTQTVQAFQTSCDKYIKTYNVYEELIDAKVVERYSLFSVTDWSVDSQFEGIILTPEAPENPELRIQISSNKAKMITVTKFEKWSMDERYRRADFDPIKAFANAGKARMFTVELRKGIQILCTETKEILTEN